MTNLNNRDTLKVIFYDQGMVGEVSNGRSIFYHLAKKCIAGKEEGEGGGIQGWVSPQMRGSRKIEKEEQEREREKEYVFTFISYIVPEK